MSRQPAAGSRPPEPDRAPCPPAPPVRRAPPFRELLGLTVEGFAPRPDGTWTERIRLEGAEAVATVATFDGGGPSVTRHAHGAGVAWYPGTRPGPAALRALLHRVRDEAGVHPVLPDLPEGTHARTRVAADGTRIHILLDERSGDVTVRRD